MAPLSSHDRFQRMFDHKEADRVPIVDSPWHATIERWHREGMPTDIDYVTYFGLDRVSGIGVDNSPRYPVKTLEDTEEYSIFTSSWGVTMKNWKHMASTPEFLAFTVVDPDSWREAKQRMVPDRDRVPWTHLQQNYANWRKEGHWIEGGFWFGFDITHAWFVGTERLLLALAEEPDWCVDMFNHELDLCIALMDMVWDAGYTFDCIRWPDDMGYKYNQFFSVQTYRDVLKPVHKRAVDWAHAHGIPACLHSCGDVHPLVPELVDIGIDCLNPLEVKAGMDPIALKHEFGSRLVLHGGINALLYDDPVALEAEMHRVIPTMKRGGGYILSSDHSVPSSMSLESFRRFVEVGKELGRYGQ